MILKQKNLNKKHLKNYYQCDQLKHHQYEIIEVKKANTTLCEKLNERGEGDIDKREDLRLNLINTKNMSPKVFAGKPEESFRSWAKKLRAYCNGSRPGFRRLLKWIEEQQAPIDPEDLDGINLKYKHVANEVLYDFLVLHTSDDALIVVELQN